MKITGKVYKRIKRALAQKAPERDGEFEKIAANYDGDPRHLGQFMDIFGSDNPWEAAGNSHLRRSYLKARGDTVIGKSGSGHFLTDQMYLYTHTHDPSRVWISGSQMATKIREAFGTQAQKEAFSSPGRERISRTKREQARKTTKEFVQSLEEVLADPTQIKDVQSRNERIQVQKILEVDDLRSRLHQLKDVIFGNTAFLDQTMPTYHLALGPGGTFLGRFKREAHRIPAPIRDIYTTITDPHVEIPETERRFLMGSLIAWTAANVHVEREAALGGYQQDLDFVMRLPPEHYIIQKFGKPDLLEVLPILQKPEITLIEATKVFDIYPINEVRREFNSAYAATFKELPQVLERLKPLFIQAGKWREDSLGNSVPLERLKKTVYFSTLRRADFFPSMYLLRLETLAGDERPQAMPMGEWKQLIDGAVTSARQIKYMDSCIGKVQNAKITSDLVKKFSKELLRGKGYDLAENFELEYGFTPKELIRRIDFLHGQRKISWTDLKERMEKAAHFELYRKQDVESLNLLSEAKTLVPCTKLATQIDDLRTVAQSPLLLTDVAHHLPLAGEPYATTYRLSLIAQLSKVAREVRAREKPGLLNLLEAARDVMGRFCYDVQAKESITFLREKLQYPADEVEKVQIINPGELEKKLTCLEQDYLLTANLTDEWKSRALFLVSRNAGKLLRQLGLKESTAETYSRAHHMSAQAYLRKEAVNIINQTFELAEQKFNYVPEVIISGVDALQASELYDTFHAQIRGQPTQNILNTKFPEFNYHQRMGVTWRPVNKAQVGDISEKVAQYNQEHDGRLKLKVTKL